MVEKNISLDNIHFLEINKEKILDVWLNYNHVKNVLKLHEISTDIFKNTYATGIFDYYISILKNKEKLGMCPIMNKYLEFLHDKDVMPHELFMLCVHFKKSILSLLVKNDSLHFELYEILSETFNQNLNGLLARFEVLIRDKDKEIKKQKYSLEQAQRISQLGYWELDIESNELDWSEEVFKIFEINPNRSKVSYEDFLSMIHPDDRNMVNEAYMDSLKNHEPYFIEHRVLMKDGRVKYVIERGETHYDDSMKAVKTIGTIQDVSKTKELQKKVFIDPLTQLYNRHYLTTYISSKFEQFVASNSSFTIALCDIDYFKKINDTYGHDIGDEVLKVISKSIKENVRSDDIVCRYGGEEFLILLPNSAIKNIFTRIEKVKEQISNLKVVTSKNETLNCTVSIGLSEISEEYNTFEKLLKSADLALYKSKANGRNTITISN